MFNLPLYVGLDYHTNSIQVCVMNQQRKIFVNQSVENSAEANVTGRVFFAHLPPAQQVLIVKTWRLGKIVRIGIDLSSLDRL